METIGGRAVASMPSIKGSILAGVVEDLKKLVAAGGVSMRELGQWLHSGDLELLEKKMLPSDWYDIRIYTRMNELLRDVEGEGSSEYLREAGKRTARRLLEGGLYAQLKYLHRTEVERERDTQARFDAFGRDLRLLTTLSGSILNFSRWEARPDPDRERRYRIEVNEARDFPEVLAWRSDGFINEMATRHGDKDLWTWKRESPDVVLFPMTRSL